jgi:hypothetical protein
MACDSSSNRMAIFKWPVLSVIQKRASRVVSALCTIVRMLMPCARLMPAVECCWDGGCECLSLSRNVLCRGPRMTISTLLDGRRADSKVEARTALIGVIGSPFASVGLLFFFFSFFILIWFLSFLAVHTDCTTQRHKKKYFRKWRISDVVRKQTDFALQTPQSQLIHDDGVFFLFLWVV